MPAVPTPPAKAAVSKKPKIVPGSRLHTWKMINKLGEGGFGAVWEVADENGEKFAMKTERVDATSRSLKMEVIVLRAIQNSHQEHHFCCFLDSGRDYNYNYFVMTLIGKSLGDIRKSMTKGASPGRFSLPCVLSVGMECLEAIHHLHETGFLHRDIKPANFAVAKDDPRRILLFDFGLCRRYLDADKTIRRPRWSTGFRGTYRYASISVHISREMSPKDDVESWFYQQVELTVGCLPWGTEEDLDKICQMKDTARGEGLADFLKDCPMEYTKILEYIDELRYYDIPNYAGLMKILDSVLKETALSPYPYDWENE